jgi:hypothetical protein
MMRFGSFAAFFATDEWLREHAEAAAAFRRARRYGLLPRALDAREVLAR